MKFTKNTADIFIPDNQDPTKALSSTTHLGICAHQDDLEFFCFHGIGHCFNSSEKFFSGVTCSDGSGSSRSGKYADSSDKEMQAVRRNEQKRAASIGKYSSMIQLDYSSAEIKSPDRNKLITDLKNILRIARPDVIYTHNLADKHQTHVAVALATVEALRELAADYKPMHFYGVEGWRNLDWLPDSEKKVLDVSEYQGLAEKLTGVFDSQIAGGKRYDLATIGRWQANATFLKSHQTDEYSHVIYALDLYELIEKPGLKPDEFICKKIDLLKKEVAGSLAELLP